MRQQTDDPVFQSGDRVRVTASSPALRRMERDPVLRAANRLTREIDAVYAEWLALGDRLYAMQRESRRLRAVEACDIEARQMQRREGVAGRLLQRMAGGIDG